MKCGVWSVECGIKVRKKTVYNFESGGNGVARRSLGAMVTAAACKRHFLQMLSKLQNSRMLPDLS